MKYPVHSLFHFYSGSGQLTEQAIYNNQPKSKNDYVLVHSGATDDKNNLPVCSLDLITRTGAPLIIGGGILVSRKGQAGSMRIIIAERFTINDNAYVLTIKSSAKKLLHPQFFVLAYQELFFDLVTSKDGNGTFSKGVAENLSIWLPSLEMQLSIVKLWAKQAKVEKSLRIMLDKVNLTLKKTSSSNYEQPTLVSSLVNHFQGHQITDEELYNSEGSIPVFSGADARIKGFSSETLVDYSNLPCLSYQTKGNTETRINTQTEPFNANNTAIMTVKNKMKDKISLEYLKLPLRQKMAELRTSEESVSYIDKRILSAYIPIPFNPISGEIDLAVQEKINAEYLRLQTINTKLEELLFNITKSMNQLGKLANSLAVEPI